MMEMIDQPPRVTPPSEFESRLAKVREQLALDSLDGLMCYGDAWRTANIRYFTDFRPVDGINGIEQAVIVLSVDHDPVLYVVDGTLDYASEVTRFDVRPFRELDNAGGNIPGAGRSVGLAGHGQIPVAVLGELTRALPGWNITPTDVLARVKAVKSPWEVEQLRAAARLTDVAMEEMHRCISSGEAWTERDLARAADCAMITAGADGPAFLSMVQSGPRSSFSLALPSDRRIQRGDLVLTDVGARYGNYVADGGRGFTVGDVSDEILDVVDTSVSAVQAGLDALRPGIIASELNHSIQSVLLDRGYGEYSIEARGRGTGHGTGMDPEEELPWIGPTDDLVLQTGMVFTLKATINKPGVGGLRTEHIVHLREHDSEILDNFPMRNHW